VTDEMRINGWSMQWQNRHASGWTRDIDGEQRHQVTLNRVADGAGIPPTMFDTGHVSMHKARLYYLKTGGVLS